MSIRKKLDTAARAINKVSGATNMAKYVGESIAKRKNPAVERTVSKKDAYKSAARTALTIATLGGVGAKLASKAKGAKATVHESSKAWIKRTYSGHEKEAFKQAAKRNSK